MKNSKFIEEKVVKALMWVSVACYPGGGIHYLHYFRKRLRFSFMGHGDQGAWPELEYD